MLLPFSSKISNLVKLGAFKGTAVFTASYVPLTSNTKSSALLYPSGTVVSTNLYLPASAPVNWNLVVSPAGISFTFT